jgi:prepilin-type N-terminal cleavage/methylation domain-containing protein
MVITTKRDGFSLIEVAVGMLIIGILIGPMFDQWNQYKLSQEYAVTNGNIAMVETALQRYVLNNGAYPAPADPGDNESAAGYGMESTVALGAFPACVIDDGVACQTTINTTGGNPVLIGVVPFATLGLPQLYAIDGYGMLMTYAVTANLTDKYVPAQGPFVNGNGAIQITDSTGNLVPPPGGTLITNAQFIIVSHGVDRVGAFSQQGVQNNFCFGVSADITNCNNDGIFNNNYGAYTDTNGQPQYGRLELDPPGPQHYDDYVGWTTTMSGNLWVQEANTTNVLNNNGGNVKVAPAGSVGIVAPQAALDIRGVAGNPPADG